MYQVRFQGNKYHNKTSVYNDIAYHSIKEANYAAELDMRIRGKDIKSWKRQEKIDLKVDDQHICYYYIDFTITHNDDTIEYVEIKGFETATWRLKWKIFEIMYGNKDGVKLTVVR